MHFLKSESTLKSYCDTYPKLALNLANIYPASIVVNLGLHQLLALSLNL